MHQSALLSSRCLHQNEETITPFISVLDAALSGCGVTETTEMSTGNSANKLWRRRDVIKLLGATAITGPMILRGTTANAASSKVIKIGHISPQTGVFAPFAEADPFILNQIRTALAKGITNGGASYEVQIISKDSQSNTNRASEVAGERETTDLNSLFVRIPPIQTSKLRTS